MGCCDPEHAIWSLGPAQPEVVSVSDFLNTNANVVFYCLGQFELVSVPDLYTAVEELAAVVLVLCVCVCVYGHERMFVQHMREVAYRVLTPLELELQVIIHYQREVLRNQTRVFCKDNKCS